jgi:glutaredoxin-like protein NrdH
MTDLWGYGWRMSSFDESAPDYWFADPESDPVHHIPIDEAWEYRQYTSAPGVPGDFGDKGFDTDWLIRDIRANGIKHPLEIVTDGTHAHIDNGHHRLAAARAAGLSHVPAYVVKVDEENYPTDHLFDTPPGPDTGHRRIGPTVQGIVSGSHTANWDSGISHKDQGREGVYTVNDGGYKAGDLWYTLAGGKVHVDSITVHPDYRGGGVGQSLVERLHQDFPTHKINPGTTTQAGHDFMRRMQQLPHLADAFDPDWEPDIFPPHAGNAYDQHHINRLDPEYYQDDDNDGRHTASTDGIRHAHLFETDVAEDLMKLGMPKPEIDPRQFSYAPDGDRDTFSLYDDPDDPDTENPLSEMFVFPHGEIEHIQTRPDARRQGYGTALFDWARGQRPDITHSDNQSEEGALWRAHEESRQRTAMPATPPEYKSNEWYDDDYEAWYDDVDKGFNEPIKQLTDRLHKEFTDWATPLVEKTEWPYGGKWKPEPADLVGEWPYVERFLKDKYPAVHRGFDMGREEALSLATDTVDKNYQNKHHTQGYPTGPDAIAQYGYDPKEIAAGMLMLHTPAGTKHVTPTKDVLNDIFQKRQRMQRQYDERTKTAMPAPLPQGVTFHYHPTDETTPPTIYAPAIEARHDGKTVGKLEWFGPHETNPNLPHGEINMVEVHPDYRRHNIATTMFDHARRIDPAVKHSPGKTGLGRAWAEYEQSRRASRTASRLAMPAPKFPDFGHQLPHVGPMPGTDPDDGHDESWWNNGGCGSMALAFKNTWPDLKIGAEIVGGDTVHHAWVHDGKHAHDAYGTHVNDPTAGGPTHEDGVINMDVDPDDLAHMMDSDWSEDEPWEDSDVRAAGKEIEHHWFGYDFDTGEYHDQHNQKEAHLMTAAVTVYTKPNCVQCTMTKKHLDKLGIEHQTVDVTTDPEAHAFVTGLGYTSAPVVVAGDSHWSGYRPDRLKGLIGE